MVVAGYDLTKTNTCCNQGKIRIQNGPVIGHDGFLPKGTTLAKYYLKLDILRICLNP